MSIVDFTRLHTPTLEIRGWDDQCEKARASLSSAFETRDFYVRVVLEDMEAVGFAKTYAGTPSWVDPDFFFIRMAKDGRELDRHYMGHVLPAPSKRPGKRMLEQIAKIESAVNAEALALANRENYIRSIKARDIAGIEGIRNDAIRALQKSDQSFMLVWVNLPKMYALEFNTLAYYQPRKVWLTPEVMFVSVHENGVFGRRFYMGHEVETRMEKEASDYARQCKQRQEAKRILEGYRATVPLPLPESHHLIDEALASGALQISMDLGHPITHPEPDLLWWQKERDAVQAKKEEAIAMRVELRKMLGTHNPT